MIVAGGVFETRTLIVFKMLLAVFDQQTIEELFLIRTLILVSYILIDSITDEAMTLCLIDGIVMIQWGGSTYSGDSSRPTKVC